MNKSGMGYRSTFLMAFLCLVGFMNILLFLNSDYQTVPQTTLVTRDEFVAKRDPNIHNVQLPGKDKQPENVQKEQHKVAGLSCQRYGGPSDEIASEMVYWSDIPSDANYVSPHKHHGPETKYLTFEIDEGGWNNIRMSMETAVALAYAMGRTLVLPPDQRYYLISKARNEEKQRQKDSFGFGDFFHMASVAAEHTGLDIISTREFLEREIMTGNIRSKSGSPAFPPLNRTDWTGVWRKPAKELELWIRNKIAEAPVWDSNKCLAVIPKEPGPIRSAHWKKMLHDVLKGPNSLPIRKRIASFRNNPTPVDAPTIDRMREQLSQRNSLCVYDEDLQEAPVLHFMGDNQSGARLLVHFYSYIFFEDWKQDLWTKRFVRDHMRYADELQCAAARIVHAVREKSKEHGGGGEFETLHVRRGDFQYKRTRLEPAEIYENVKDVFQDGATVYVASDERNVTFFDPLREQYNIYFMDDFREELTSVNTNYYGMIDQLVASRGRTFAGTFFSTFSGYIHRIIGYHSQKDKSDGYAQGRIKSYYHSSKETKNIMTNYVALEPYHWAREWPVGWRDIDKGIEDLVTSR